VDAEDIAALEQAEREGRLHLVAGDADALIPGVRFFLGGRHTYASQFVGVETRAGTVVLASDNVYLYENLEKRVPIAQTSDAQANLAAQDRMRQIASRPELIVPGHDPEVFVRFPKPGNGVARIAGPAN
jgi:glyoxylase-like metal-dependent hydrolase (beta-lactamase superfamily II)